MKGLFIPMVMAVISVRTAKPTTTTNPWTTGRVGVNLNGKMFTMSSDGGGISLYPPFYPPPPTTPYTPYWSTATPWTTAPPTRAGFSVCLRFLTDYLSTSLTLLKLYSHDSYAVNLGTSSGLSYSLSDEQGYFYRAFQPSIRFWPEVLSQDMWTRVCVTVDNVKKVGQVFSGSNMSIRKMMKYSWGIGPMIYVPGFDGQLTDVQMWDYPLGYGEIIRYMRPTVYRQSRGSVLTWSNIGFSCGGDVLLEDAYEIQGQQSTSRRGGGGGRRLRGGKKSRRGFRVEQRKSRERELQ